MFRNDSKRAQRRVYPIHAYTGPNGGGKTCAMVWDTLPSLAIGRPVLSTVRLLDVDNPRPCDDPGCPHPEHVEHPDGAGITHLAAHPLWQPLTDWSQVRDAEHCDMLLDEVTGVASSRESHSMPAAVANKLVQLRRADVVLRWSAPAWARSDKIIRECSQAVTYCRGYLPKMDDQGDRQWRNRRLFRWSTYDASEFEDFTAGKREQTKAFVHDLHWGPGSPAFAAYDTFDAVLSIGSVSDAGRCLDCDGRRTAPECTCSDYVHRKADAAATVKRVRARASGEAASTPEPLPDPAARHRLTSDHLQSA